MEPGQIVILNGVPRSGKSSIVAAMQELFEEPWMNLGVDVFVMGVTPERLRPGLGLRPGGERPDLEPFVKASYLAMYGAVAAHARAGLNVVVDVGHHDAYSRPQGILAACVEMLEGLPVLFVGVRCPLDVIMARRNAAQPGREGSYVTSRPGEPVPGVVVAWQREVHRPGVYDMEVDTSILDPAACARMIGERLRKGPAGTAFAEAGRVSAAT